MLWVEEESEYLAVSGYIGKPSFGQRTRGNQYLFVNRRPIVNRNINYAVFSAYEHLLIKGTFPFFLLFLEIDPRRIDVNVHPSKLEAKFDDEQSIYRFVSALVRKGLASSDLIPAATIRAHGSNDGLVGLGFTNRQHYWPGGADAPGSRETPGVSHVDTRTGEILEVPRGLAFRPGDAEASKVFLTGSDLADRLLRGTGGQSVQEILPADQSELVAGGVIWQLHSKYILLQIQSGVMIVDQHVAHERVLYEQVRHRFDNEAPVSQQLLFPRTIQLTAGDYALVTELLPHFALLGFDIKPFGKNTILVEGVPPDVKGSTEEKIIVDVLSLYKEFQHQSPADVRENLAKSYSCKAAIKAGDPLSEQEMRSLIAQLFAAHMPYVCPHGRPIVLRLSIDELDRRFGRT
jgi:DNA mismatch repair protein MutL